MISPHSQTLAWIEEVSLKNRVADKTLLEKVIRALSLLEGLAAKNLEFVFKGGTALMLLLGSNRRLSIHAAKAAYLAKLIQHRHREVLFWDTEASMNSYLIADPERNRLNKLKKSNPEAFFYWFQALELDRMTKERAASSATA